jgi:hypothetical protein
MTKNNEDLMSAQVRARLTERIAELEATLTAINAIRNSIIGAQTLNWSEHIYPLVAVLDNAGVEGLPYPDARKNVGTLLERIAELEREVEHTKQQVHVRADIITELQRERLGINDRLARVLAEKPNDGRAPAYLYIIEDSKRLQWMQFNGARVEWENDGEVCSVSWSNRDGSYRTKLFDNWRLAIDTARTA